MRPTEPRVGGPVDLTFGQMTMNIKAIANRCAELVCVIAIVGILYNMLVHTYFVLPRLDERLLQSSPTRDQVFARFGDPSESITKGERFKPSGWVPCPDRPASHEAHAFQRPTSDKIYIYFDASGKMEEYVRG